MIAGKTRLPRFNLIAVGSISLISFANDCKRELGSLERGVSMRGVAIGGRNCIPRGTDQYARFLDLGGKALAMIVDA